MANKTITDLTEDTAVASDDLVETVQDPGGTPASRKATVDNLMAAFDHGARAYNSAVQSISNGGWVVLTFDSEDWDTDSYHDTGSNTSRMTIPAGQGGKYLVTASGGWASDATGRRLMQIYLNGTTQDVTEGKPAGINDSIYQSVTAILDLSATDYVEIRAFQSSGGALDFGGTGSPGYARFSIQRLA